MGSCWDFSSCLVMHHRDVVALRMRPPNDHLVSIDKTEGAGLQRWTMWLSAKKMRSDFNPGWETRGIGGYRPPFMVTKYLAPMKIKELWTLRKTQDFPFMATGGFKGNLTAKAMAFLPQTRQVFLTRASWGLVRASTRTWAWKIQRAHLFFATNYRAKNT